MFALQLHAILVYRWIRMYVRKGPTAVIGNLIGCLISAFVLSLWASAVLDKPLADILPTYWPTVITALIWIPYFLFSNRVKLTFGPISLATTNVELPVDLAGAVQSPATAKSHHITSRPDDEIYLLTDADSRRPTAPNAISNIVKADHDALVTDEELLAEGRNEMPPSSASKAPARWRRIWLPQLLVACLLLVATVVLIWEGGKKQDEPATPGSSVAQPRTEPSATPQVEDAPPKTPEQMDFEDRILSSPLVARAMRRRRIEDLVSEGKSQEEAEKTALKEQEGRAVTPNNAQVRETVGGALNATPDLAAVVARLTGEKEAADRKRLSAKEVYDNAKNSVVFVTVFDGTNTEPIGAGTGFVVSEDGLIATNFHVIEGAQIATVSFADGRVLTVEGVVGVNRVADLALLKVGGTNLSFLKLGSKELPQVGKDVYALGNPRGRTNTLSPGIVTRESEWTGDSTRIQTNAAISPGSSGGPLLDEYGTVVGITTGFILDSQNLNLAVPVELLARLLAGRGEVQTLPSFVSSKMDQFEKDSILQLRPDRAKRALAFGVYELGVDAARRADQPNVENSDQLWESAIESLNKAVEIDPSFVAPRIVLACIHEYYKNEHDKAKQLLDDAIRREPTNAEAHYYLADVHYDDGNEEDAIRELNLAVNLDPYFGLAYRLRSRLYEARNELTEAALDLNIFEALAGNLDADHVYPWTLRSVLFRSKESGLTLQYSSVWYPFESMAKGSEIRLIRHDHARAIAFSMIYLGEVFHPGMKREEMVVDLFEGMREAEPSLGTAEIVRLGGGEFILDRQSVHWIDYEIESPPLLATRSRIFMLEHAGKVWSIRFSTPRDEVLFRQYLQSAEDVIRSISFH